MPEFYLKDQETTLKLEHTAPGAAPIEVLRKQKNTAEMVGYLVDNEIRDFHMPMPEGSRFEAVTLTSPQGLDVLRHTCAHVLAQAVKTLFPEAQITIGPVIENGYFYDISRPGGIKEEDLPKLEKLMREIVRKRLPIRREDWEIDRALEFFKKQGEIYKCEIISDLVRDTGIKTVSVYWHGDEFVDLCRGPHLPHTGLIPALKLMSLAGAYWRGDEKNEMLIRIYGTAFSSQQDLDAYLKQIEEAKRRDHRRIGVDQQLFSFHPEAPQAPFFHPNGALLYAAVQNVLRDLNHQFGFSDVISPLILSQEMWKISGHYDNYRENMYFTEIDERAFAVKPMNCPGHCLIYKTHRHSYRELPMRFAEFGRVHRHERSGVTAGLFRVRSFVQDDAHIFCTEDQVQAEIENVLKMVEIFYRLFGFSFRVELSTRPEKRIGGEEVWDKAEGALASALKARGFDFKVNPGDGAFYGPKIDFHLKDSIGRTHQCGTIQLDFSMPGRFGLEYNGSDNHTHTPVLIHRAIAGSLERFLGIYIEHVAGAFPVWLAPKQVAILTVGDEALKFGEEILKTLKQYGVRIYSDFSQDKLGGKIKSIQPMKIPYTLIIGSKESESQTLTLRKVDASQVQGLRLNDFVDQLKVEMRPQLS